MTVFRHLVTPIALVLTMGLPGPTRAAAAAPTRAAAAAPNARPKPKVLRLEELKVEGKIQKPQAMFLMPRAHLNVGELDRREPLLPRITAAVEKDPF